MGRLRLLTGRIASGKSERIYEEMRSAYHAQSSPVLLIVPEQYASEAERELPSRLCAAGFGFGRADVLSPRQLLSRLRAEQPLAARVQLDERGLGIALCGALEEIRPSLRAMMPVSRRSGFAPQMVLLFNQLRASGVTAEQLATAANAMDDSSLSSRLSDVAAIYARMREIMGEQWMDAQDAYTETARLCEESSFLENALVYVDRFDAYSRSMALMFAAMAYRAREVTLVLNYDDVSGDSGLYIAAERWLELLREAAQNQGVPCAREHHTRKIPPRNAELAHMERELHALGRAAYCGAPRTIALATLSTPSQEAAFCAARVVELVRERKWRYSDIAVVCPNLETYAPYLASALSRSGVPFFLDAKRPALTHPCARALLGAVESAITGFRAESMLSCLCSGYAGVPLEDVSLLHLAAFERGLKGSAWQKPLVNPDYAAAETHRQAFISPLIRLATGLSSARTARACCSAAIRWLDDVRARDTLAADVDRMTRDGHGDDALLTAQMWDVLADTLAQVCDILGDRTMDAAAFLRAFEAGLSAADIGIIPPTPDQVLLSTVTRLKTPPIKALIVLGATDSAFPPRAKDALFSSDELEIAFTRSGVHFGPSRAEQNAAFKLRVHAAMTRPSETLIMTLPLTDENGAVQQPSPIVGALKRIFPQLTIRAESVRPDARAWVQTKAGALAYALAHAKDADPPPGGASVLARVRSDDALEPVLASAERMDCVHATVVSNRSLRAYLGNYSITRLEHYARCPFLHMVADGLRPRFPRTPFPTAPETGTRIHAASAAFLGRLMTSGVAPKDVTREMSDRWALAAAEDAFLSWERDSGTGGMAFWRGHVLRTTLNAAWASVSQLAAGGFAPVMVEQPFRLDEVVSGQIDRVDILRTPDGDFCRVIDLKTYSAALRLDEVYAGMNLQLPLYLAAACRELSASPAGLYHVRLIDRLMEDKPGPRSPEQNLLRRFRLEGWTSDDPAVLGCTASVHNGLITPVTSNKDGSYSKTSCLADASAMDALLHNALLRSSQIRAQIESGTIRPHPAKTKRALACDHCQIKAACPRSTSRVTVRRVEPLDNQEALMRMIREMEQGG